tara:strand:- start:5726 stop:6082 length:357 start_codon:yes stop_codon:yes gene_type:complete
VSENEFDFGFTAVDEDELARLLNNFPDEIAEPSEDILAIKEKLDLILELNSTCEGASAVKVQYDELMKVKFEEIEGLIIPVLQNLMKNETKDYLYWPGKQRSAQCELQLEKILQITRS